MEQTIKPGDIVKLKSGSPHMTVDRYFADSATTRSKTIVVCVWFDADNKRNQNNFNVDTLEKVK